MRRIKFPVGLPIVGKEPLSGPRTIGAGKTESIGNFAQSFSSPFGLWRWRFDISALRNDAARRYRGWVTALHGGANFTVMKWCDWDQMSFVARGIQGGSNEWRAGSPWSNGMPWSNGKNWHSGNPKVAVDQNASFRSTSIYLGSEFWGNNLDEGDMIGFEPLHLGWYMITERISTGTYRIWPPLRKAITTTNKATLNPSIAFRLEGEDAATAARNAINMDGLSVTFVEVLDADVRAYVQ